MEIDSRCIEKVMALDEAFGKWQTTEAAHKKCYPDGEHVRGTDNCAKYEASNTNVETLRMECKARIAQLGEYTKKVRCAQIALSMLSRLCTQNKAFPNAISYGRVRLQQKFGKHERVYIPRLVKFPIEGALWLPSAKSALTDWVEQLILRLLQTAPLERLCFYAADPRGREHSLDALLPLLGAGRLSADSHIINDGEWVKAILQKLDDYCHKMSTVKGLCVFVIVAPEGLTDENIAHLTNIIKHGAEHSVLPFVLLDETFYSNSTNGAVRQFAEYVKSHCTRADTMEGISPVWMEASVRAEQMPSDEAVAQFVETVNNIKVNCGGHETVVFEECLEPTNEEHQTGAEANGKNHSMILTSATSAPVNGCTIEAEAHSSEPRAASSNSDEDSGSNMDSGSGEDSNQSVVNNEQMEEAQASGIAADGIVPHLGTREITDIRVIIDVSGSMTETPKPAILKMCARVIDQTEGIKAQCVLLPPGDSASASGQQAVKCGSVIASAAFGGKASMADIARAMVCDMPCLILSDGYFAEEGYEALLAAKRGNASPSPITVATAIGADANAANLARVAGRGHVYKAEDLLAALDILLGKTAIEASSGK